MKSTIESFAVSFALFAVAAAGCGVEDQEDPQWRVVEEHARTEGNRGYTVDLAGELAAVEIVDREGLVSAIVIDEDGDVIAQAGQAQGEVVLLTDDGPAPVGDTVDDPASALAISAATDAGLGEPEGFRAGNGGPYPDPPGPGQPTNYCAEGCYNAWLGCTWWEEIAGILDPNATMYPFCDQNYRVCIARCPGRPY
jgi:hypothetical protein